MKWRYMFLLLLLSMKAGAEIRWTGFSANGLWADPGNWESGILPGVDDDIVLDNSYSGLSYAILLPDFAVQVNSISILPAGGQTITLELPVTNLLTSTSGSLNERALTVGGDGYSMVLGRGGVFINASGSNSGYSIRLQDSLQIQNGGKYIHRSRTSHAELVEVLSKSTGTETGIFRFENPDAASTISLSARVFGSLQLSASGNISGSVAYSASGTNPVLVRGDLVLEQGAALSVNFDDTITVHGNFHLTNTVFNLASGNRSSVLLLRGNWIQSAGTITETNIQQKTGTILMQGDHAQTINCSGILADSIILEIRNVAGVELVAPLRCPFGLRLSEGPLKTTQGNLLILGNACWLQVDSTAASHFIDGPMKKEGLAGGYFFFPVGRNGRIRWLATRSITGDVQVEYHPETAAVLGSSLGAGIDHISQVEYWSLKNAEASAGQVELFYDHDLSGGVSELVSLRVAGFSGSNWMDAGNAATTGAAFASGSVTSNATVLTGIPVNYFTLASSSSFTNVLPVLFLDHWLDRSLHTWSCNWRVDDNREVVQYEIELSEDGTRPQQVAILAADHRQQYFRYTIPAFWVQGFCRIKAVQNNAKHTYSDWVRFGGSMEDRTGLRLRYQQGSRNLQVESNLDQQVNLELYDGMGRLLTRKATRLYSGFSVMQFSNHALPAGIYHIVITGNNKVLANRSLFVQ